MAEKEYIEREKILQHLSDQIEAFGNPNEDDFPVSYCGLLSMKYAHSVVRTAPKADVVEVVRCEHCKHSWFNGVSLWLCQRESNYYCPTVKADAFCSYGERKEATPC